MELTYLAIDLQQMFFGYEKLGWVAPLSQHFFNQRATDTCTVMGEKSCNQTNDLTITIKIIFKCLSFLKPLLLQIHVFTT